ncbi:hypothetical protein H634G_05526 [Metarhizium anisopliae BRIP 53293]|uniref:Uncharacterized protein n=1 Tax=Metarhizium anisopliae BRIP 53293 TaxID=1291518 RepID=A0A0D9NZM8_METAN|nr:hypothetical protein H634G_05526 [Metarhizium anisopliae BRIP 53293]
MSLKENNISIEEAEAVNADNDKKVFPWLTKDMVLDDESAKGSEKTQAMDRTRFAGHTPDLRNQGAYLYWPSHLSRGGFVQELCPYNAALGEHNAHQRVGKVWVDEIGVPAGTLQPPHLFRKAVYWVTVLFKNTFDQALQHPWFYSPSFQKVLDVRDKIADGKLPGARLLCLDFEFCALTKTVFEVGVLEYCSGKNIIDAAVQGNIKTLSEIPISTIKDGISKRPMSTLRRHSYENPQSPRDHSSCYADILPPDENCVLVIMERSSMTSSYDLLRWLLRRHVDGSRGAAAPEPEWHQLREAPSTSSLSLNVALLRVGPS